MANDSPELPLDQRTKDCPTCGPDTVAFDRYCGAWVCGTCGQHDGLARCYCGWSATDPGHGRQELAELGETIEADE